MKLFNLLMPICLLVACNSYQKTAKLLETNTTSRLPVLQNDSIEAFLKIDAEIHHKVDANTSLTNAVTQHFLKYISEKALQTIAFKEWRREIYVEFALDLDKKTTYCKTNTASEKLDRQIKRGFKRLDFDLIDFPKYDSRHKYTLVIVQQIDGKPVVSCSEKVIDYIPPIYELCSKQKTYQTLNNCNYRYISSYINNHIDISKATEADIDYNHYIHPKFIIDKNGKVVAAKIESQNKALIENYYKTIKSLPKAKNAAKINGEPFYFGYFYPTAILDMIQNNKEFINDYAKRRSNGKTLYENLKKFIIKQYVKNQKDEIFRVGF